VFFSSLPGIWEQITQVKLNNDLLTATGAEAEKIKKTIFFQNFSRILLLALWTGIAALVYVAYRKRKQNDTVHVNVNN
jgi:hypothetical protein